MLDTWPITVAVVSQCVTSMLLGFRFSSVRVEYQFPDFSKYRAILTSDGQVRWEPAGVFETSCIIDITFYPYDTQVSHLNVY